MRHTLTWEKGRQLKCFDTNTYTYNANGIRISKTVNGIKHTYILDGTKILKESYGDNTIYPLYNNEDEVCGIQFNEDYYFFLKNLQNDVIAITDDSGKTLATYTYDAWGKCTITSDISTIGIAEVNPYRYRSYYYDSEIDMYYLQSRYYDPNVGRFINADDVTYLSESETVIGYNLYNYCENKLINAIDPSGYSIVYIYGSDQKNHAQKNIKLLKSKYTIIDKFVYGEKSFASAWNNISNNQDIVIINLHGRYDKTSKNYIMDYVTYSRLNSKTIDTLLLLVCHSGHQNCFYTNPAYRFFTKNNIRQLICCDGEHRRSSPFWSKSVKHWISATGDYNILAKNRNSRGFLKYTWAYRSRRSISYVSIGYSFSTITKLLNKVGKW